MLLTPVRRPASRRDAFTLLEVLVVVAILIVLAGVATFAVLPQLDNAKNNKALLDMKTLETAYKTVMIESGETDPGAFQLEMLIPKLEQGAKGLLDPWGKQYRFEFITSDTGEPKIQFSTSSPKGDILMWPRP